MYIKNSKSIKNRRKAYVILESIVILSVISCICMLLNKVVVNNYLKSSVIYTKDDIKTLSEFEESILIDAMNRFENGEEQPFVKKYTDGEVKETIINIDKNFARLIKKKGTNGESYIDLECKVIRKGEEESIRLIPKLYKTDYIIK